MDSDKMVRISNIETLQTMFLLFMYIVMCNENKASPSQASYNWGRRLTLWTIKSIHTSQIPMGSIVIVNWVFYGVVGGSFILLQTADIGLI